MFGKIIFDDKHGLEQGHNGGKKSVKIERLKIGKLIRVTCLLAITLQ